jgi:hypothetical protein
MGLISDQDFLLQQAFLGSGFAGLVQAHSVLESGLALVVSSTDIDVEVAMLDPYVRNVASMNPDATAGQLRVATEALERHVTNQTGQTLNDYLFTHGLKVSRDFASLSEALGAPINEVNIL